MLDDKDFVIDSVPEENFVRFIARADVDVENFSKRLDLSVEKVPDRLEDGFMTLLNEDERKNSRLPDNMKLLYFKGKYSPAAEVIIVVKNFGRKFGDFTAVDKTNFEVQCGEVFGLIESNGAGKTTTFRMLCGLLPITDVFLSVAGVNLRTARTLARANIGYVAQKFSLYGNLTVQENLNFFGRAYGLSGKNLKARIEEMLTEFRLRGLENKKAGDLPGGYK